MKRKRRLVHALLLSSWYIISCRSDSDACNNAYGNGAWMGDGACDPENLRSECDWDGGDCCRCTCEDEEYICGADGFLCIDPDVLNNNSCEIIIPSPCPTDVQQKWVVENTADVRALAKAVNCSDGIFDVEWKGSIIVDTEIVVVDGTFLNFTGGSGLRAILDGGNGTRLFRVVNASLQLNGIEIRNGNTIFGGAIMVMGSTVTLNRVKFANNAAYEKNGGAIFAYGGSNISFSGSTEFFNNSSKNYGGALYAVNSSVSWEGVSSFSKNSAFHSGGALCAVVGSTLLWEGEATFDRNHADSYNGGALFLEGDSHASWSAGASFTDNDAGYEGGAIFLDLGSEISWSGQTVFSGNNANLGGGGAILIGYSSNVMWSGEMTFVNNMCGSQGGAVSSRALGSTTSSFVGNLKSSLLINSTTMFANNTCKSKGGGLAMLGGLSVLFETNNTTFMNNKAKVAGGAVFILTIGEGPTFTNGTFLSNSAETGGAIFITGSSTSVDNDVESATFEGCAFIGNRAEATGGAIESATGTALFTNTIFRSNNAKYGGALRLSGSTEIDVCTFEGNISELDGGQAISFIGPDLKMNECTFRNNAYDCDYGTFFNESVEGSRWEAICSGCDNCTTCVIQREWKVSTCSAVIDHTTSYGGYNSTLMTLIIDAGYWRVTNYSTNVLACYNEDACNGGLTDSENFCSEGYKGPYCSICIDNYMKSPGFTCRECPESVWGIVAALSVTILAIVITFAVMKYVMSAEMGTGRGLGARLLRHVPLQSVKIIIVAWQIMTQFATIADVTYPGIYQSFLSIVDVLNFDVSWMISAGCFIVVDFHGKLLLLTLGPIMIMSFLSGTFIYAARRHRASQESLKIIGHKHVSVVLLVMFLFYSSASSAVFQMFDCEVLDDHKNYLRADYTIECDGKKHKALMIYAGFMILVYPLGIPAVFAYLLFLNRDVLADKEGREDAVSVRPISDLWKPYRPSRFYYEVVECGRRIVLTGVILIVDDDSAAQIAVTLFLAFVFTVMSEGLAPYESQTDAWVCRLGNGVVVSSMYYALLLKVDVSNETQTSQSAFEVILIIIHVLMVAVVIGEATVTACSLTRVQMETSWPRTRPATFWTMPPIWSMRAAPVVSRSSRNWDEIEVSQYQVTTPL